MIDKRQLNLSVVEKSKVGWRRDPRCVVFFFFFFQFVCFSIYSRVKTEGFEHNLKVGSLLFFPLFVTVDKSLNFLLYAFVLSSSK